MNAGRTEKNKDDERRFKAGLSAFRFKFRTGLLRLVQRQEKRMWMEANKHETLQKVVKKAAAYSVITQGSNFKGDSKSLSRFRFAFRTAIMKKIDYMERFLEG